MSKWVACIGNRDLGQKQINLIVEWARKLAKKGYWLRSGGARGADRLFETSAVWTKKEIFRPEDANEAAVQMARAHHPNFDGATQYVKKLLARNAQIIFGRDLDDPVEFVVTYSRNGFLKGGSAHSMRMARDKKIPVFNLHIPEDIKALEEYIK